MEYRVYCTVYELVEFVVEVDDDSEIESAIEDEMDLRGYSRNDYDIDDYEIV